MLWLRQLDVLLIGMDIFWNKQVRKFSYKMTMFYVSYYLAYSYLVQIHKKSTRGRRDMLNIFCLLVLQIRIATIIKENAKFNDKFYLGTTQLLLQNPKRYLSSFTRAVSALHLRLTSPVATPCEVMENLQFVNKMVTSFD